MLRQEAAEDVLPGGAAGAKEAHTHEVRLEGFEKCLGGHSIVE